MRIAQIGPYPVSKDCIRGGVEASVYGLAQEQSRTAEVHVFDLPRIDGNVTMETDGKVVVHRYRNEGRRQASTSRLVNVLSEEIEVFRPDVCHIHGTGLFSWLMYRQLVRKGLKVLVTVHGLLLLEKRNMLKKRFTPKRFFQYVFQGMVEKHFLSRIPIAIVDTAYVKEKLNDYPIRRKPMMYVIPQGICEDYFRISCSEDSRLLLSVGAIGERKGHLLALEAFERVKKSGVECKLVIAGIVANHQYCERLKEAIAKSEFRNDIELFIEVSADKLKELYRASHVFVLHTEEESQGIVFAESMAAGMPVVSTKVGGVPFVVEDGVAGLLSNYGDVELFANHMSLLLNDRQLWHTMSVCANKAAEKYHWASVNEEVMKVYRLVE